MALEQALPCRMIAGPTWTLGVCWPRNRGMVAGGRNPDTLKDPQNGTPQYEPIATLGKLGDY